jgi:hypothetical protein
MAEAEMISSVRGIQEIDDARDRTGDKARSYDNIFSAATCRRAE